MITRAVEHCELRWQFKCPLRWDALRPTGDDAVRSCDACHKLVYLCRDKHEAARHAQQGHCTAIPRWVLDNALERDHARMLPEHLARKLRALVVDRHGATLLVATSAPENPLLVDEVMFFTGYHVELIEAPEEEIEKGIERAFPQNEPELGVIGCYDEPEEPDEPDETEEEAPSALAGPVGKLIGYILRNAHRQQASQIKISREGAALIVRFLVDGAWEESVRPPLKLRSEMMRQLRGASGVTSGQDGRLRAHIEGLDLDYRVRLDATTQGNEALLWPA